MAPARKARSSPSLRRLVKVKGMNTVPARRPHRKDQVDRNSRRHLAAVMALVPVMAVAVVAVVVAVVAVVVAVVVVDDLNPSHKCNELRR